MNVEISHPIGPWRRLSAAAALAACVLSASCAAQAGTASAPAQTSAGVNTSVPPKVPQSGLTKGLALPLEAYMLNYADELVIERAEHRLTAECMRKLGFTYQPPAVGTTPQESSNDSNMPRRYGISDLELSAKYGYHPQSAVDPHPDRSVVPISPAERAALLGTGAPGKSSGGCIAESRQKLQISYGTKASELSKTSLDTSLETNEVKSAMQRWSDCMKNRGYSYTDVYAPLAQFNSSANQGVNQAEIQTTTADIECKSQVRLIEVWFATETVIQQRLIEQNQLVLAKEQETIAQEIRNSSAVR
ncbi:hypothetical protein [Kitasatospora sp. NPDC085879]|uniref:hypothetical protein n=1 Tax=Kitasatospora sp. NPDC085879 TaxID=3154769 RepID=UPI00343E319F